MQDVEFTPQLDGHDRAIRVGGMSDSNLYNPTAYPLEGLGVLRHPAELEQLQLISDELLRSFRKCPQVPFRVPYPDDRA